MDLQSSKMVGPRTERGEGNPYHESELPHSLEGFRNFHRGETIVVCGCGKSLGEFAHHDEFVTIGVNDVGRLFQPTYLVVLNAKAQFSGDRFEYIARSQSKALFTQLNLGLAHPHIVRFNLGRQNGVEFETPNVLPYTRNSPYVAVCLAAVMGAKRIALIGVDFTDDHFFGRTGRHPLASQLAAINQQYLSLGEALRSRGVTVLNLSGESRLSAFRKGNIAELQCADPNTHACNSASSVATSPLKIISYATTPVAGVPAILARCISDATVHQARCVWARNDYGNGVIFDGDVEWTRARGEAEHLLREADLVIVHNGKVDPAHRRWLAGKSIITMAHNYGWNVDMEFVRRGQQGVVVGQYQATLPEFTGWHVVPNPIPLTESYYAVGEKSDDVIHIAYTPSGRHERYPPRHRLYWHSKGWASTMAVLERLARTTNVRVETTSKGPVSHAEALAIKRRAHIVIDECVTGSYHRNSLEGLAAGAVVVNGVGLLPGVVEVFQRCAPSAERIPFVRSDLDHLETTLRELIAGGAEALAQQGHENRKWMERNWRFDDQWARFWAGLCELNSVPSRFFARAGTVPLEVTAIAATPPAVQKSTTKPPAIIRQLSPRKVSVIVPHGGVQRLPHLQATLASLRQSSAVHEVIVAETGPTPVAGEIASRWADKHLFVENGGAFERATILNAGQAVAEAELLLWHDNDLLSPPDLIERAAKELIERRLDFLVPYSSIRYLSESDSNAVLCGQRDPHRCAAIKTFLAARHVVGGIGLVRRDFVLREGGLIEGFQGWGGEDTAWMHKVRLLGATGATHRNDQHVYHLFHPDSGGYRRGTTTALHRYYAANVAICHDVLRIRTAEELRSRYPPSTPAPGKLAACPAQQPLEAPVPVWTYWEGVQPDWIAACLRTLAIAAPNLSIVTPDTFQRLWDQDRDIDLQRLCVAHRADYIRAFLLMRFGGLWVDADCVALQPLQPLIEGLGRPAQFVGYRERSGLVSNNFMAAPRESEIIGELYGRICATLRSQRRLGWTSIGSEPLNAILNITTVPWTEIRREQVAPICWSEPERFFARGSVSDHSRELEPQAWCYMLSHSRLGSHLKANPGAQLLAPDSFLSFLLARAAKGVGSVLDNVYERTFASHVQLYRKYRDESMSGPGSTLGQTSALRRRLPLLLAHLGVTSLLDAPCGDFNWMQHINLGLIDYTGVDVQREIIASNQIHHANGRRSFIRLDVTCDALPRADAIFCRDLLTHLSYREISAVLGNFQRSGARYLITTTYGHDRPRSNADTADCEWRPLDLTRRPLNFPQPLLLLVEGCTEAAGSYADKALGVWPLADLAPSPLGWGA